MAYWCLACFKDLEVLAFGHVNRKTHVKTYLFVLIRFLLIFCKLQKKMFLVLKQLACLKGL